MCSRLRPLSQSPIRFRVPLILLALAYTTIAVSCHRNEAQGDRICDAAGKGDLGTVQSLLKGNPKLVFSKDNKSDTPLHLAASHGYPDVVELLLADKAEVDAKTDKEGTRLQWAADKSHLYVAELLIANKADVNAKDNDEWTPLQCAAYQGHADVVTLLLTDKADPNTRNKD